MTSRTKILTVPTCEWCPLSHYYKYEGRWCREGKMWVGEGEPPTNCPLVEGWMQVWIRKREES